MALTVENGTGLSTADSYLSEADADTYHVNHGNTSWAAAVTGDKETALRNATQYLDLAYGQRLDGVRLKQTQSLDWPRANVSDRDGYSVGYNSVPVCVADATAEAALRSLTESLLTDVSGGDSGLQSESIKVGSLAISQTYLGSNDPLKTFSIIDRLMAQFVSSSNVAEIERA